MLVIAQVQFAAWLTGRRQQGQWLGASKTVCGLSLPLMKWHRLSPARTLLTHLTLLVTPTLQQHHYRVIDKIVWNGKNQPVVLDLGVELLQGQVIGGIWQ